MIPGLLDIRATGQEDTGQEVTSIPRKAFSTTLDAGLLEDLKLLAVKLHRPVNTLLEEAAEKFLREKGSEDPDLAIFRARAREPEEDCMREIEARLRRIKARRA